MAFCSNCGAQLPDGTKFCPDCGQKIVPQEPAATPAQGIPAQPAAPSIPTPPAQPQGGYTPPAQPQGGYTPPAQPQGGYTPPAQPGYQQQNRTPPAPPRKNGAGAKRPLVIIGLVGVVLVATIGIGISKVLGGKNDKAPVSTGTAGGAGTSQSGAATAGGLAPLPGGDSTGGEATALQEQWNGTWYGCMYIRETGGNFADIPEGKYDTYMVVDVDGSGKGQFAVYLANANEAFALGNCSVTEAGLYASDGTVAGGYDMYAYNWMFLPMPDYPDQYTMGDVIEDGDSTFDFSLFMKQWGGSWQKEIDSDFAIVPPSVSGYNAAIASGELPPVGFAPLNYQGTAAAEAPQPAAESEPETTDETESTDTADSAPAALHEGEPSSTGDGMLASMDDLYKLTKFLWDMDDGYKATYCTYDFVVDYCGVEGLDDGNHGPNSMTDLGDHYFFWKYDDTRYIFAGFRPDDSGKWILKNMNTSGFMVDDIPDSITVRYPTATELGAEKSEFAGPGSQEIECFMTDIMTTVNWNLPYAGWFCKNDSREIRLYNVPSLDKKSSGSPLIEIDCQSGMDRIDLYLADFENLQEIEGRTIAGVDMKGRTYEHIGMDWTEYYGELPSGAWLRIRISKIDLSEGSEGEEILNSLTVS